ncbi:hypothetical protein MMC30_000275 [Trapelia coarctata]|nr:hypothetical protein [Trapelia coarctata]
MSSSASAAQKPRPALETKTSSGWGWGWPRLVDIPTAATSRRSSSVRSHTGAVQSSERSPTDRGPKKRASSLTNQSSSASPPSEEVPAAEPAPEDTGEVVLISEAIAEVPESAPKTMAEESETCHDPEHQPGPRTTKEIEPCHDPEHQSVGIEPSYDSTSRGTKSPADPKDQSVPETAEEKEERHGPEHQLGEPEHLHNSKTRGTEAVDSEHQPVPNATKEGEEHHNPKPLPATPGSLHEITSRGTETAADPVHKVDTETTSSPSHSTMPVLTAIGQAIGLLSSSSGKQSEEPFGQSSEEAVERAPETPAQPDPETLPPLPASPIPKPAHDSSSGEQPSINPLAHPISSDASATSVKQEIIPRPFPVFRELPAEPALTPASAPLPTDHQSPMPPSGVAAPSDVNRLPPPRILVIRASGDSREDLTGSPITPDSSEDSGNPFETVSTTVPEVPAPGDLPPSPSLSATNLPDAPAPPNTPLQGVSVPGAPGVPGVPLPTSDLIPEDLIPEDLGAVNIPAPTSPPRITKGKKMIRKTRKVVLRSPVLTIILGRQLALLTRPAIKIIAQGSELPPMAVVGETVGTVAAPLGAVGAVGKATA